MSLSKAAAVATIVGGIAAVIALFQSSNLSSPPEQSNAQPIDVERPVDHEPNTTTQIRACTDIDFYQIGWNHSEPISGTSGWIGGGSNPTNWCNQLINRSIQGRSIGTKHEVKVLNSSEEGRWTGTFGRTRQYNYHCTIQLSWDPKFEKKENVVCQ